MDFLFKKLLLTVK